MNKSYHIIVIILSCCFRVLDGKNNCSCKHVWKVAGLQIEHYMEIDLMKKIITGGLHFNTFKIIQEKLNYRYELISPIENVFGTKYRNGSWDGIVGQIIRNEADFGFVPLYITIERFNYINFSTPLLFPQIKFLIKAPEKKTNFDSLLRPFTFQMWLAIILSTSLFGLVLYQVIIIDFELSGNKKKWTRMRVFWFLFGSFTYKGENLNYIKKFSSRCIIAVWWLSVMVIVSGYSSTLKSFLTYPNPEQVPTTFHKLASAILNKEYSCGIMRGSAITDYIMKSKSGVTKIIANHIISNGNFINDHREIIHRIINSRFAFIDALPYFEKLIRFKKEEFLISEDSLVTFSEAYGLNKKFTRRAEMNKIISRLLAAGIIDKDNYFDDYSSMDTTEVRKLIIEDLSSPLILLICGYILSIACFVMELLIKAL